MTGSAQSNMSTSADHSKFADLVAEIRETNRMRDYLLRAEKNLLLQEKAIGRRLTDPEVAALATLPLSESRKSIYLHRRRIETRVKKLAIQLPAWQSWAKDVSGFGALGFAQIVAEAGDLNRFPTVAKLWRWFGLAVIDGQAERRHKGQQAGFDPRRRSVMYCIGDALVKQGKSYRAIYLDRKQLEMKKMPDAAKMVWHMRAQRYMEKQLLKHLWQTWRQYKND